MQRKRVARHRMCNDLGSDSLSLQRIQTLEQNGRGSDQGCNFPGHRIQYG
jgi:hypothetical protein